MPEISTNYAYTNTYNQAVPQRIKIAKNISPTTIREYYRKEARKDNGLIEKFYNWVKNTTGLGVGSKKVQAEVEKAAKGEISTQSAQETIHKYNSSQENSAQIVGDTASIGASALSFFWINQKLQLGKAWLGVNKPLTNAVDKLVELGKEKVEADKKQSFDMTVKLYKKVTSTLNSNKKALAIAGISSALVGGLTKFWTLKLNRIGSEEFKLDENIYKKKKSRNRFEAQVAKSAKKELNKERRKVNFKNFVSGTINGLMMPVMALGGVIGTPIYLAANSLNRYFVANKTDKEKSFNGYLNNLKLDGITTGLATAAVAIPLIKKGNFAKLYKTNIEKVTKELAEAKLNPPEYKTVTAYNQLEDLMLNSPAIKSITESKAPYDELITKLTDENIFAVKFKQISTCKDDLARALQDDCPPTRTLEEAQKFISEKTGSDYTVKKLIGVGTVAETYLAKDASGQDVCIKILKNGISKEKIEADKQKFINLINSLTDKSADEKEYLIRNLEDLASGISKEVDLKNEMDNAIKLAKTTHLANVVEPIETKNNVYVMKKAKGINLKAFIELNRLYVKRAEYSNRWSESVKEIDAQIKKIKERMPEFADVHLSKQDSEYLLQEYQKVYIEQFHKIDKNGKIIHGDIHPGNIFIDPEAFKNRKGKLFTLIDTGNMIDMSTEQSLRALNLTKYIKQGNAEDIANYVLDGAKLPSGMSKEEALEKVVGELKRNFYDHSTRLETMTDEKILALSDGIMQKFNIIPGSTQLNLNKCRKSAQNSLADLQSSIWSFDEIDINKQNNAVGAITTASQKGLEHVARNMAYNRKIKIQEKQNLKQLTPAQKWKELHNPNAPKGNSEEYLTYRLKQHMVNVPDIPELKNL